MQSAAQHSQEDAAIAAQVRREMWGNLQSILAMLAGEGCSPHVQEMVHQIAVHFVNEQSQSVALGKRMTCDLSREKEAQKRLQQQLRGSIQVLYLLVLRLSLLLDMWLFTSWISLHVSSCIVHMSPNFHFLHPYNSRLVFSLYYVSAVLGIISGFGVFLQSFGSVSFQASTCKDLYCTVLYCTCIHIMCSMIYKCINELLAAGTVLFAEGSWSCQDATAARQKRCRTFCC